MSLDIRFRKEVDIPCPHCGKPVYRHTLYELNSGGRGWYEFLESIGYYVPFEQRTEENDWYAKDMTLTSEQMKEACLFAREHHDLYDAEAIHSMIASAIVCNEKIVVNADW